MQLSKIVMTSLLGFALASPVERRTAAEIEADIATISSDLTSFNTAINAFTGSLLQALSLLTSYNTLASAITAATSEVTSTGALAAADSATIYADVDSLTAQITDTLSDATAKSDADAFFTALEGTIDSAYTSQVDALQATVASGFASTISTYGC
ncbi:hypothetical protein SLS63_006727 [Diaporthe eres]|uniref:Hydrophobic surface binding protein A n=1 Tax=Diaporthe eres TaxID=83184 RepID=A0ABR1P7E3_DIAER